MPEERLKADTKGVDQLDDYLITELSVSQVASHAYLWHQEMSGERVGPALDVAFASQALIDLDRVHVLEEVMAELVSDREALAAEVNRAIDERDCCIAHKRAETRDLLTHRLKGY